MSSPICITGMHRSGTSMVAHLVHASGVYLGDESELLVVGPDNEAGFWENPSFVAANEAVLQALGGGWEVPPTGRWKPDDARLGPARVRALGAIGEMRGNAHWGWKDPRTCLTLPLWQSLIPDLRVVLCLRNPLEVAVSLQRRNTFSYSHALRLWCDYNRTVIAAVPAERLVVAHYESFFVDPVQASSRLARSLELEPAGAAALDDVVLGRLRHNRFALHELFEVRLDRDVLELYLTLCKRAEWSVGDDLAAQLVPASRRRGRRKHPTGDDSTTELVDASLVELHLLRGQAVYYRAEIDEASRQLEDEREAHAHAERELELRAAREQDQASELELRRVEVSALEGQVAALAHQRVEEGARRDERIRALQDEVTRLAAAAKEDAAAITALEQQVAEHVTRAQLLADVTAQRDETIRTLQEQLEEQTAHAQRQAAETAQRDETIRAQQQELAVQSRWAREASERAERQAAELEKHMGEVAARDATIRALEESLAVQSNWGRGQSERAERQSLELRALGDETARRQAAIDRLEAQLGEQATRVQRHLDEERQRDETIRALQAQLEEQVAHAQGQAAETAQRDETIHSLQAQLDEQVAHAQRQAAETTQRDETIRSLQGQLEQQVAHAQRQAAETAQRDETIRALQTQLDEQVAYAQREAVERAKRDDTIRSLEAEVAEQVARAQRQFDATIERDEVIRELQREAAGQVPLADHAAALAERDARLRALERAVADERALGRAEGKGELEQALRDVLFKLGVAQGRLAELGRPDVDAADDRAASRAADVDLPVLSGAGTSSAPSAYQRLVAAVADVVRRVLPPDAAVAVVSKGDSGLVAAMGARAVDFPKGDDGGWAGYYPHDSGAAINHLSALRSSGIDYLLFPAPAFWWLDHYYGFRDHLRSTYDQVWSDEHCIIFDLTKQGVEGAPPYKAFPGGCGVDVVCFPIIDWDFRFQRPQQLLTQFARDGHRVFYVRTRFQQTEAAAIVREVAASVYEIQLPGPEHLNIYQDALDEQTVEGLLNALHDLRVRAGIVEAISLVDLPFWAPLAHEAKTRFNWKTIYDCMDEHGGFAETSEEMVRLEHRLVADSDLVVATSRVLHERVARERPDALHLPNASDFEHFATAGPREPLDLPRPIVGYYGAIAEWFDVDLVKRAAVARPEWSFVLIGSTAGADVKPLRGLRNVHLLGEQPYDSLPGYLHQFDVACIPFRLTPLTEATNPVKFYEYLSAGKPVVAVELPELAPFTDFFYPARDAESFVVQIERALAEDDPTKADDRRELARQHTWEHRYRALAARIADWYPRASIIVVSYDNLGYLQLCLESVWAETRYPNFEVIVVDNASSPDVVDYLRDAAATEPRLKLILNDVNAGFARANNLGIAAADRPDYVFLLNDDTVVTRGWLGRLIRYLQDDRVGLVGPVTNWAGNEAKVEVPYEGIDGVNEFALSRAREFAGEIFDVPMLAMYCLGVRKDLLDQIGTLDERFDVGMFEDDDFAMRVRKAWYRVVCAEDVFVHHWGRASFDRLDDEVYRQIFERNRKTFEEIWGTWQPHRSRQT